MEKALEYKKKQGGGDLSSDSCGEEEKAETSTGLSLPFIAKLAWIIFVKIWLIDVIGFGIFIPLTSSVIVGKLALVFELGWKVELIFQALIPFVLLYLTLNTISENNFWRDLFKKSKLYCGILLARDILNIVLISTFLRGVASTIQDMTKDKSLKPCYFNEGVLYVLAKHYLHWVMSEEQASALMYGFGIRLPHKGTLQDMNLFGENERFVHAARLMLYIAMLSVGVGKMIYFNTLSTYVRAMDVFLSLKPIFEMDEQKRSRCSSRAPSYRVTKAKVI